MSFSTSCIFKIISNKKKITQLFNLKIADFIVLIIIIKMIIIMAAIAYCGKKSRDKDLDSMSSNERINQLRHIDIISATSYFNQESVNFRQITNQ